MVSVSQCTMVGSLLYAAMATRPDIAQAVSAVSKFNANPNVANLTAVKRILILESRARPIHRPADLIGRL